MTSRPNVNSRNNPLQRPLPPPPSRVRAVASNNNHRPLPPPPSRAPFNVQHDTHRSPLPSMPPSRPNSESQNARFPSPPSSPPLSRRQHFGYDTTSSSSSASFRGCCCCLCLLFSFIALLALAIVLVVVLAVKPKKPQFDLQRVGVQYMGITTPNLFSLSSADSQTVTTPTPTTTTTSAALSLNIRLLFTAVNPNKVGIKYGNSRFTVMYRGIPLGKAIVPGFYQEAHSQREVEAMIAVDRVNLLQADAADLIRDASLNDRVELRVLGEVGARIRVLEFDSPGVQVSSFFFPFLLFFCTHFPPASLFYFLLLFFYFNFFQF